MYIKLAPIRLKDGIDEKTLLEASDAFERDFVRKQRGIIKRLLLRGNHGDYADLVFFESKADADRVVEIEATSDICLAYFKVMEAPDANLPDMGVLSFDHMRTYD
jgi:hypothetical protein